LDARAWRVATLASPFVVQIVLGLLLVTMWLLGKWPFETHSAYAGERAWMLTSTVITTLTALLIGGALLRSPAPRNRGLALSIAGSSATVLTGGIVYAYLVLR
jgi:hypothetical protein